MIAQVQSNCGLRNRIVNDKLDRSTSIFIKDTTQKMQKAMKEQEPVVVKVKDQKNKKWEAKKDVSITKVERKDESQLVKIVTPKMDGVINDSSLQA